MTTESHINQLFNNLDAWRHLPAYQLERRADIFFSLYLAEALECKFSGTVTSVIPEFPCRTSTDNFRTFKIDYLIHLTKNAETTAYLVELKTDMGSVNTLQNQNMERARVKAQEGLLIPEAVAVRDSKNASTKYEQLRPLLENLGGHSSAKLLYILPKKPSDDDLKKMGSPEIITFDYFASIVEQHPDYLSLRFAKSLREWAKYEAGNPMPKAVNE